jgi:hypothetical protein
MKPKSNILDFEVMRCARENKISYKTALRVYGDLVFQDVYSQDFEMFCMGRPNSDYHEQMFKELRDQVYDKPETTNHEDIFTAWNSVREYGKPIQTGWTNSPDDFYKFWHGDDDKF